MSQLDTALAAIPLWITLVALVMVAVLGAVAGATWRSGRTATARRTSREVTSLLGRVIADAAPYMPQEAHERLLHRLRTGVEPRRADDLSALADAVSEDGWQPPLLTDRKGGQHRAR